jgi:hypothetical protein
MTVKDKVLRLVTSIPFGSDILREYRYLRNRRHLRGLRDAEELFTLYYRDNLWHNPETFSGPGSTVEATENIRRQILDVIMQYNVRTVLDAPCGDFNWFRLVPRTNHFVYTGADIVQSLVDSNKDRYTDENTTFMKLDIRKDKLPHADLWLCRDCLPHLPNRDIFRVVRNLLDSDIRYFLTSTYPTCELNTDIPTGVFRVLNLEGAPFGFPKPLLYLEDGHEGIHPRRVALWERQALVEALGS